MVVPRTLRPVVGLLIAFLVALGLPVAGSAAPEDVRVITYDASQSEEFQQAVDAGAQVWNEHVQNVKFEPATGGSADVVVVADDGWPRTQLTGLGQGKIWMGRQAVQEGYDEIRIAAHELGHILGLPDDRTGVCEDLMSGASAGPECTSAVPNSAEIAEVEANFAEGKAVEPRLFTHEALTLR
ncbi:snapalysin family zinc-dependent metalloprotease [Saccharopolyspora hordei]|uniref:Extracellular small neutral protease n=1 Tax=Saccharopolyspora hordei TaxID=1838 RepID=A0A853AU50_9PSEU|nr:snapalysin family zinc-dependent metalloprotease [Saccharopolyspora hordei]NYI86193.1 snapalysin [Saccharopolyspora hordei]